jgi:glycyl-tRNA synthetase
VVRSVLMAPCCCCCGAVLRYIPSVIEPSFGIGRILYHILEHAFYVRPEQPPSQAAEAKQSSSGGGKVLRAVLRLPPHLAPVSVAVLPLSAQPAFAPMAERLVRLFTRQQVASKADSTGSSIGRRYARCDEVGIPFAVTIDFDSLSSGTVTLRERDSCQQVRLSERQLIDVVKRLCLPATNSTQAAADDEREQEGTESQTQHADRLTWAQVYTSFPQQATAE